MHMIRDRRRVGNRIADSGAICLPFAIILALVACAVGAVFVLPRRGCYEPDGHYCASTAATASISIR
jgi:hypothetical protein